MKTIVKIKEVYIENFKNIKSQLISLDKLTDLYGKNSTGKSSVLEAIHFLVWGGKNDVNKIRVGAPGATVSAKIMEGDVEIEVSASIDRSGRVTVKGKTNGISSAQPRGLLQRLFSFGSFDPRLVLAKDRERTSRLLSLIPIKIKPDDLFLPDKKVNHIPLSHSNVLDYSKHGFDVLKDLEKDVKNSRMSIGREHKLVDNAYRKRKEDFDNSCLVFNKTYNKHPVNEVNVNINYKEEVAKKQRELGGLKVKEKDKEKQIEDLSKKIEVVKDACVKGENKIDELNVAINKLLTQKKQSEELLKNNKEEVVRLAEAYRVGKDTFNSLKEELKEKEINYVEYNRGVANMYEEATKLQGIDKELMKEKKEADSLKSKYDSFDFYIKNILPLLKNKILKPIEDEVPGLSIQGDEVKYNGVSVDTLSGSEIMSLSIKLLSLESKANLLFINEAECMDEDTIQKLDLKDFSNVVIARVGKEPLGNDWKSINMEEKTKEVK